MKFKAGKYLIVDLCYAVPSENWDELCSQWFVGSQNLTDDVVVSYFDKVLNKDVYVYAMGTMHGDGGYKDNLGNVYGDVRITNHDGNVFDFEDDFEVYSENGVLYFGNISINTDYDEVDYDDTDYDDFDHDYYENEDY